MTNKLDVVFLTDINYLPYFTVALTSLLENNLNSINRIFLVHDVDDLEHFEKILDFFSKKYNKNIELLMIDSTSLDSYSLTHQLTKATYFRLYFANLLPKEIDKVLFLDSDIIVRKNIDDLLSLDFKIKNDCKGEYYVYAVDHKFTKKEITRLRELNFVGEHYFNAGVLLINLKKWREDNVTSSFISTLEKYNNKILWADQDILNLVIDNQWGKISYNYNAFGLDGEMDNNYKIIHYIGMSKPWQLRNKHPYKYLYWKYIQLTPFKRRFPEDLSILNVVRAYIVDPLLGVARRIKRKIFLKNYKGFSK